MVIMHEPSICGYITLGWAPPHMEPLTSQCQGEIMKTKERRLCIQENKKKKISGNIVKTSADKNKKFCVLMDNNWVFDFDGPANHIIAIVLNSNI